MTYWERNMMEKEKRAKWDEGNPDIVRLGAAAVASAMNYDDYTTRIGSMTGNLPSPYTSFLIGVEWDRNRQRKQSQEQKS